MAAKCDFTLDDFRKKLDQLDKMGDMRSMIAGMPSLPSPIESEDPKEQLQCVRRMIDAMTEEERRDLDCIDIMRRQRIAAESGTTPETVDQFLGQFRQIRELMRQMARMSIWDRIKRIPPPESEEE
jgi:signal recognition particle subunit SRP54